MSARNSIRNFGPDQFLTLGRFTMLGAALGMVGSALIAYPFAQRFGLGVQVASHLALPVSAAFFKIGYVVRLAAHHALGNYRAG